MMGEFWIFCIVLVNVFMMCGFVMFRFWGVLIGLVVLKGVSYLFGEVLVSVIMFN